jgi:hypothetical protein
MTGTLTTNTGGADAAGGFLITSDSCAHATLAAGASCVVHVTANTQLPGARTGHLTVSDGASDTVQSALSSTIATPGALTIAPTDQPFGTVVAGGQSSSFDFTIKNTGSSPTTGITTSVGGNNPSDFVVTADNCNGVTLAAQATCTVTIHFQPPSAAGAESGTLSATATTGGTAVATLEGTSVSGASLTFNPTSLAFGTVDAGATALLSDTVSNFGGVATGTLGASIGGTNPGDFAFSGCTGSALGPDGGNCSATVSFTPASRGARSASLDFTGIDGGASLALSGTGRDYVLLSLTQQLGTGGGTITSDDGVINCGTTCTDNVARTSATMDPIVTLTATPDGTSTFGGWGGACSGSSTTCAVTMSQAQNITFAFSKIQYTVTFKLQEFGPVSGVSAASNPTSNISCTGPCSTSATFNVNTPVTISASGTSGYLYSFAGDCAVASGPCSLTVTKNMSVTLTVSAYNYAFISYNSFNATTGISGADTFCQTAANNAHLPGTYKAFLSTSTQNANARYGTARGWVRLDGQAVMDTMMTTGNATTNALYYPINITERGTALTSVTNVITGSHEDGSLNHDGDYGSPGPAATCQDWTSLSQTYGDAAYQNVWVGYSNMIGGSWTVWGGTLCNIVSYASVYCLGTDLTRTLTITPPTPARHFFVSTAFLNSAGGLSAGDAECQLEAQNAGLSNYANYIAFLATNGASAASRLSADAGAGANWIRTDGIPIATSAANFLTGTIAAPPIAHANKTYPVEYGDSVWYGATSPTAAGTTGTTCQGWTSNNAGDHGAYATVSILDGSWGALAPTGGYTTPCNAQYRFYCIEP